MEIRFPMLIHDATIGFADMDHVDLYIASDTLIYHLL